MNFFQAILYHPIILFFLMANLAIGIWAHGKSKSNSFEDYALASHSLPTGVLVMTLLATRLDFREIAESGYIYQYGMIEVLPLLCYIASFFVIGTFIAPLLVHFQECMTTGDIMDLFYGKLARFSVGILGTTYCLLMVTSQIRAIGDISAYLLDIPPIPIMICFGVVVVLYSIWGGMRPVSYTDVLQAFLVIMTFSWVAKVAMVHVGGLRGIYQNIPEEKLLLVNHPKFIYKIKSAFFWAFFPNWVLTPPIIQRMLVVQNKRQVRRMWYIAAVLYTMIAVLITLIGFEAIVGEQEFHIIKPYKQVLIQVIKHCFKVPLMLEMVLLGLLSVLLSTIDSYLHTTGISFVQDVVQPMRSFLELRPFGNQKKLAYARHAIMFTGGMAIFIACRESSIMESRKFYIAMALLSATMIVPLLLGIIGLKTNKASWLNCSMVYWGCIAILSYLGWHVYDIFLVAVPLGIVAYLLTHVYLNGGFVTVKRSEKTVTEQLWIPSWQGSIAYIKAWLLTPFYLHTLVHRKVINYPMQPLSFSTMIFALYTFSTVITGGDGDVGLANFMVGVHVVGIGLVIGLMLEGVWADRLKPYFALYWFFTLFYCLAFGNTLVFLRTYSSSTMAVSKWIFNFMLLAFLVDSISFMIMACVGIGLSMALWYVAFGGLPAGLVYSLGLPGGYLLGGLCLAVLVFVSSRERYMQQRLTWNRTASSILGHDLRATVQMLGGAGRVLNNAFKTRKPKRNPQGEEGYWVPKAEANFLGNFSEEMIKKGKMAGREIKNFSNFIENQVIGIFEQEKVSIRMAAEDAIRKLAHKAPKVNMQIAGKQDFRPKVLSGVLTNMFYNLLWNAVTHGQASKIEVKIDDNKRAVTIWDNGIGIPSEVLPHIFDLNFSTGSKCDENSGVGLAFVKMVISASSGKISCHSRHGDKDSFTAFLIDFPKL